MYRFFSLLILTFLLLGCYPGDKNDPINQASQNRRFRKTACIKPMKAESTLATLDFPFNEKSSNASLTGEKFGTSSSGMNGITVQRLQLYRNGQTVVLRVIYHDYNWPQSVEAFEAPVKDIALQSDDQLVFGSSKKKVYKFEIGEPGTRHYECKLDTAIENFGELNFELRPQFIPEADRLKIGKLFDLLRQNGARTELTIAETVLIKQE